MPTPPPRVQLDQAQDFVTRTPGVQVVYSGPCRVHQIIKRHGTNRVRVYNGSTADPLKVDYTPPAALPTPAHLLGPTDAGAYWDKGITIDNTGAEEITVIYSPIV